MVNLTILKCLLSFLLLSEAVTHNFLPFYSSKIFVSTQSFLCSIFEIAQEARTSFNEKTICWW